MVKSAQLVLLALVVLHSVCFGLGQNRYIETVAEKGSFAIVRSGVAAPIYADASDHAGAIRAAKDLDTDIARVTGITPTLAHDTGALRSGTIIIIGTIGKSPLIDRLVRSRKINVQSIAGKWESFLIQVVSKPLPGVASALIIAGSDKRGTIFGIYDLSEQIGVSPWYWWADVPVQHKDALFVKAGAYIQGPPAIKYRGIFLNDEAPSLTGWVKEKYGTYNHEFYEKVFELLLRLKANYLWPAMWNNAFNEDDPLNPKLADEYGIVMGTSHHEPMLRAQQEWKRHGAGPWDYSVNSEALQKFWDEGIERNKNYESIITLGMRGDGDLPMSESANISLLEKIVDDQRKIIARRMNKDLSDVPQDWALYKEVQEYYEKGMRVPDDVTLLWCDDNWGNVRRLPTEEERKRSGGAGIYYHFDYVGDPRSYKWLNTIPITKVWEQMNLSYEYGADRIWIVNVGDLKPMEFPIEFFLTMAREPRRWPKERIPEYTRLWAEREFGPEHASAIAEIVAKYTKLNGLRKPELIEPTTFSLVDYQEADGVLAEWQSITSEAEKIYSTLPENMRDAFYELVLYPTKASALVTELYITAGRNNLYAVQGRASTNDLAAEVRRLFQADDELSQEYNHTLAHGKWDHMMDQTHLGYTFWNQPPVNVMPAVQEVQVPDKADMGIAVEGSAMPWLNVFHEPPLPAFDVFNQQRRFVDVFNRGTTPFQFNVAPSAEWIHVMPSKGTVEKDRRVWVSVDWEKAPPGATDGSVTITGPSSSSVTVKLLAFNPSEPTRSTLRGFVETDGYVSIEAEHYTKQNDTANVDTANARWEKIDDYGRTFSSMTIFPVTAKSVTPPTNSPSLEYQMYLFHPGKAEVEAILAPTLNFVPGRGLRYAISFDDEPPQIIDALAQNSVHDWEQTVEDGVRKVKANFNIENAGYHTLKFWMVDPGVVLQKLVVNLGGVKPSYLGPPESYRGSVPHPADEVDQAGVTPPMHLTSEQDQQRLMDLLHIAALRRGPDGDPKSPNAANFDESKVTPYSLPDPLVLKNGKKVDGAKVWWKLRRPEIVEDFDREIYGRVPKNTPKVNWELTSTTKEMNGNVPVITKKLVGHADNSSYPAIHVDIQLTLTTPANAAGPVPVMMELGLSPEVLAAMKKRLTEAQLAALNGTGPPWQQQVLAKGWGFAILIPTSIQADSGDGLTAGIIGLVNHGQPRQPDDWGALRTWAWGASRALDYFETDKSVDAKQVGIEGLSRYGKAALVAMAYDPRFAIAFIGSSGEGGAKILRRRFGEQAENLASTSEYHWMAGNFLKFAGPLTPNDLPVDSHELIAVCAPRPVFISSGSQQVEGGWVDAKGMFLGAVGAGPVYKLLGKEDLGTADFPPIETALIDGDIAFRQHTGGHTTGPNWPTFLDFASRYIKVAAAAASRTAVLSEVQAKNAGH
jgi:hypothetical protein